MSSRENILQTLRKAQKINPIESIQPKHFDTMIYDREKLLEVYMQYQKANMSNIVTTTRSKLADSINDIIRDNNIRELLCAKNIATMNDNLIESLQTDTILYDTCVDENRDKLFNIEASILHAQVGVANLGILGLGTNECNPRLASLVVKTCIILLRKEDIVSNLFEAFKILKISGQDKELPTNIVFLAGPSRTADIELQTVFGVHGPQHIHVVLYE